MINSADIKIPQICDNPALAKKFFINNGYHIERNHYDKSFCSKIINSAISNENYQNKIYSPLMMPHRENAEILKAMKDKNLVKYMNLHIGDNENNICGLQSEFFFGSPGTRGFSMHQDSFYTEPSISGGFGSAWIPMVDIEKDMGNLIIYNKSHLTGKLPVRKLNLDKDPNQDPNANNEETDINEEDYEKILINENQGSIVFIHGDLIHSSIKNNTNKFRYVLLLTYIRSNCKFRPGNNAKRSLINLT